MPSNNKVLEELYDALDNENNVEMRIDIQEQITEVKLSLEEEDD